MARALGMPTLEPQPEPARRDLSGRPRLGGRLAGVSMPAAALAGRGRTRRRVGIIPRAAGCNVAVHARVGGGAVGGGSEAAPQWAVAARLRLAAAYGLRRATAAGLRQNSSSRAASNGGSTTGLPTLQHQSSSSTAAAAGHQRQVCSAGLQQQGCCSRPATPKLQHQSCISRTAAAGLQHQRCSVRATAAGLQQQVCNIMAAASKLRQQWRAAAAGLQQQGTVMSRWWNGLLAWVSRLGHLRGLESRSGLSSSVRRSDGDHDL